MAMKEIGVGLLGFGTVGSGVVEGLERNADLLAERLGMKICLRRIADIDLTKDRGVKVDPAILTQDAQAVVNDPNVDIIVELIGGTGVARKLLTEALSIGKPVVTANKALLAEYGEEIFGLAEKKNVDIYFGASVGGGIPIVRALREGLVANRINGITGILNGTCNYILTRMEQEDLPFHRALAEAQKLGYAEADPTLDIDGMDTAHKAVILASLAYGSAVPLKSVHVEGIRKISSMDLKYAREFGYRVKLLAVIKRLGEDLEVRVHPTMIPTEHVLASINGVFNAVMVHADLAETTLYSGRGAGREPTASTVLGDIADVAKNLRGGTRRRFHALMRSGEQVRMRPIGAVETRHYLRMELTDKPGVLARISAVLGEHKIGIAAALQKESSGAHMPVVFVTHKASEHEMAAAVAAISAMDVVSGKPVRLRIEDE